MNAHELLIQKHGIFTILKKSTTVHINKTLSVLFTFKHHSHIQHQNLEHHPIWCLWNVSIVTEKALNAKDEWCGYNTSHTPSMVQWMGVYSTSVVAWRQEFPYLQSVDQCIWQGKVILILLLMFSSYMEILETGVMIDVHKLTFAWCDKTYFQQLEWEQASRRNIRQKALKLLEILFIAVHLSLLQSV